MLNIRFLISAITLASLIVGLWPVPSAQAQSLKACATVPDLGSLVQEIGGEQTTLTVFAKATENAHFVVPKPSFIKALSICDVYVQMGLELEVGWAPPLLQNARNGNILPGSQGYIDASTAIAPLEIPSVPVDRSMGDVHPLGNPHYLLDPLNGLRVATATAGSAEHPPTCQRPVFRRTLCRLPAPLGRGPRRRSAGRRLRLREAGGAGPAWTAGQLSQKSGTGVSAGRLARPSAALCREQARRRPQCLGFTSLNSSDST